MNDPHSPEPPPLYQPPDTISASMPMKLLHVAGAIGAIATVFVGFTVTVASVAVLACLEGKPERQRQKDPPHV